MKPVWRIYISLLLLAKTEMVFAEQAFTFEQVKARAQTLSKAEYVAPPAIPATLTNLSYVQYQQIRFKPETALWHREKLPFQIEFFHPGYVHKDAVTIREVSANEDRTVDFSTNYFSYPTNAPPPPDKLSFAGFRIIQAEPPKGEVAVFLGATYFRMVGEGQNYGASARGLAVNTTAAGHEEFPAFREFWLQKPAVTDRSLKLFGLYDGPSAAGAMSFEITPGPTLKTRVRAAYFFRKEVSELGLAPLTSMFLFDVNSHPPYRDFRPVVHDSDGLLMALGSKHWIWRPLDTGKMLRVNLYQAENLLGFGLIQRERSYDAYQDLFARFEKRPSVWIVPQSDWGKGAVELVQIPSDIEYNDNVVAFWRPATSPKPGEKIELSYDLNWTAQEPLSGLGRVKATRIGEVIEAERSKQPNLRFVVDFEGGALAKLPADAQLASDVSCGPGAKIVADSIFRDMGRNVWRLVLELTRPEKAIDLRARLKKGEVPMTEEWMFTWQP